MHLARATITVPGSAPVLTSTAGSGVAVTGADSDLWYVTNGVVAVGPVDFELLIRGVEAGRIPPGSFIRHESWKVWRRLEDIEALTATKRQEAVERLAAASAAAEERASSPFNEPPPPPTDADLDAPSGEFVRPPSLRPAAVDPAGVLESASDLDQALALALSTAVSAAGAHIGFLHLVRADL